MAPAFSMTSESANLSQIHVVQEWYVLTQKNKNFRFFAPPPPCIADILELTP